MKNHKNKYIAAVIVLVIIGLGLYFYRSHALKPVENLGVPGKPAVVDISSASSTFSELTASTSSPIYMNLGNISYGLRQPQTKLTNGYYLGEFKDCGGASCLGITYYSHMKLEPAIVEGDLNGDGVKDAVVVVSSGTNSSASIENVAYTTQVVAAAINEGGVYRNVAAIEFTDDLKAKTTSIRDISIKGGVIYVTVLKNQGLNNPNFPAATEVVQLKLDVSSTTGFKIVKVGK